MCIQPRARIVIWLCLLVAFLIMLGACSPSEDVVTSIPVLPTITATAYDTQLSNSMKPFDITFSKQLGNGNLESFAYSPAREILAVATPLGVHIYSATTFDELKFFGSITTIMGIRKIAFDPSGKVLALTRDYTTIEVWDIETEKLLHTFGADGMVLDLVFSPDGQTLISAGRLGVEGEGGPPGLIQSWKLNEKNIQPLAFQGDLRDDVRKVIFSPDGHDLIALSGHLSIWDANTGKTIREFDKPNGLVGWKSALSPNGHLLVLADYTAVYLMDAHSGEILSFQNEFPDDRITSIAFNSDGTIVAIGESDGEIRLWHIEADGLKLQSILGGEGMGHAGAITELTFDSSGEEIFSIGEDNILRVWKIADREILNQLDGYASNFRDLEFSPDGQLLLSAHFDYSVDLWDVKTGELIRTFNEYPNFPKSVGFDSKGFTFFTVSSAKGYWNIGYRSLAPDNRVTYTEIPNWMWAGSSDISLAENIFAAAGPDRNVWLWNFSTGEFLRTLPSGDVLSMSFSPNGRKLAMATNNQTVEVFDAFSGDVDFFSGSSNGSNINILVWHPDGNLLFGGDQAWSINTQKTAPVLEDGDAVCLPSEEAVFSPDGNILVGSNRNTLCFWNVQSGSLIRKYQLGDDFWISKLAFSPTGRILAVGDDNGTIRMLSITLEH